MTETKRKYRVASLGEILMRLSAPAGEHISQTDSFKAHIGGSEANVMLSLSQWGHAATFLTRLPENDLGDKVMQLLHTFEIDTGAILRGGERLALYFEEKGSAYRNGHILYDRAHSAVTELSPEEVDWVAFFENTHWFHWSAITPSLSANCLALTQRAIEEARKRKIPISVDLHHRKNLWQFGVSGWDVLGSMVENSALVVSDPNTLIKVFQPEGIGLFEGFIYPRECLSFFEKLATKNQTGRFAMLHREVRNASHHNLGGLYYDKQTGNSAQSQTYEVYPIIDRVGGGDAFMAGLIHGILHEESAQQVIEYATGASVIKHSVTGDFNLCSENDVKAMIKAETKGIINR